MTDTNLSNDELRVTKYLGLNPDTAYQHIITIRNLLHIEMMEGRHEMHMEIARMMSRA